MKTNDITKAKDPAMRGALNALIRAAAAPITCCRMFPATSTNIKAVVAKADASPHSRRICRSRIRTRP